MFEQLNSLTKAKDTSWAFLLILLPSDIFIYIFSCFHLFTLSLLLVHPFSIFYVAILTFQFSCPNNYFYKKNTAIMLFFIEVKEVKEKAMSLVILIIEWSEGSMSRLILIYQLILTRYQNSGKKTFAQDAIYHQIWLLIILLNLSYFDIMQLKTIPQTTSVSST